MPANGPFTCIITLPKIDLQNIATARKAVLDVINDDAFESVLGNLQVAAARGQAGPAPRGGNAEFGCHFDSDGRFGCDVRVRGG